MKKGLVGFLFMVLFVVTGCTSEKEVEGTANNGWPETLRLGMMATEDDNNFARSTSDFADDLSEELGIEVELFEGQDYNMMIEAMRAKKIDITNFGPFGYIIAVERSGAKPLAILGQSEESAMYQSVIVVPKDSPARSLQDLEGKDFLFVDPASTSGHLFPRASMLKELGLGNDELEGYFSSVAYSGGHDKSLLAIANGDAAGASVCEFCVEMFADSGLFDVEDVRIIMESDPIPGGPLSYREDLPEDLVERIREFALSYHEKNPEYFEVMGMKGYFPVEDSDFDVIRDTAERLNMSPSDMLN
ncbi:phosphate/phosphite/phosphonate ABC transporter substrate-binding protein [Alkalihalobacillus sp. BA299]|uniref:phosphate/phosphite/phosphonate ABC transporter substrate-binding protein n=1 Tax=Alkalihalobacillus sp. BA299 TaxID=2815938 RepID=UPI001ADCA62E|nr:phosphate/phosphite/phosphonate ABC transporter substrate-binding protein [Alkalihalobacillus sp. BA299]